MLNPAAFHEAGHAIVALTLGLKVAYITPSICELSLSPSDDFDWFLAAVAGGGMAAHLSYPTTPPDPSTGDLALVERLKYKLADQLYPYSIGRPGLLQNRLVVAQGVAKNILLTRWPSVQALAHELADRGYLTGAEVVKILTR